MDHAAQGLRGRLLHRVAEQGHGDFGLAELTAMFHELSGGRKYFLRLASLFRWKHRAAVEMGANAVSQLFTAFWAPIRAVAEQAREQFSGRGYGTCPVRGCCRRG